jgi:16S rRNA (adenine1518-N6/adenine1519-N6)-dimethyltransferase
LIAIEYDPRLVTALKEEFQDFNNLEVVQGDALSYPFDQLPPDSKVVANLPYHIATPILFRLLEARKNLSLLVLMFQREVARRIVATAGNKEYSSLSLAVQYVGQPHLRMVVSRKCFRPSPKVESAVVTLIPHVVPPIPLKNEGFFYRLIRSAFMHRRKSLKNSLREAGYPEPLVEEALQQRGIAPLRRPESLTLAEYGALADILFVSMGEL